MASNALSDIQSDASAGARSNDLAGQALAQNVFRTNPSDFLSAIQDMTSKSGSSDFLQPLTLFGGQSGSSDRDSSSSYVSPTDAGSSIAFTTDGKNLTSLALPSDSQSTPSSIAFPPEGNSGRTSNLPESNSGQNSGSSESTSSQSSIPSETNAGQTAASPESSSSGLESSAGQAAVSPESNSDQAGASDSSLLPNSSFDRMPQINQSNNNNSEISQLENQILTDMQELIQMLENRWQPKPGPQPGPEPNPEPGPEPQPEPTPEPRPPGPYPVPDRHYLQGDVAGMTTPNPDSPTIQVQTKDGQTITAPLPPNFDGTGSYSLYSDGVLAYQPGDNANGKYYLNDSTNPPGWVNYDGKQSDESPEGTVKQSWSLEQPGPSPTPTTSDLQGDVGSLIPPNPNDATLSYNTRDGQSKTAPLPSDYNGTGTFSLYSDGVVAYSGPAGSSGGECYLNDTTNPPQWINFDGPTSQRPSGEITESYQVGGDVTGIVSPDKNATSMLVQSSDNGWQSVSMPSNYDGTGEFSLCSNGVLTYCPSDSIGGSGVMYLVDNQDPPVWASNVGETSLSPSSKAVTSWTPGNPNGLQDLD